jgi:Proton-conducting membrane transporter
MRSRWSCRCRCLSLVLAGFFALRQTNYKRLLAYSLIEHMGIVSVGLRIGGPIAAYGASFHVLDTPPARRSRSSASARVEEVRDARRRRRPGGDPRSSVHRRDGAARRARDLGRASVRHLPLRAVDRHRRRLALEVRARRPPARVRERGVRRALADVSSPGPVERGSRADEPLAGDATRAAADGRGNDREPRGRVAIGRVQSAEMSSALALRLHQGEHDAVVTDLVPVRIERLCAVDLREVGSHRR